MSRVDYSEVPDNVQSLSHRNKEELLQIISNYKEAFIECDDEAYKEAVVESYKQNTKDA